jgi:PAS domain S-box-containing protein
MVLAQKRIEIVEDEAVIAMEMAQRLRDFGYDVVGTAASGDQALALAAESRPDLIMMDIQIKGNSDGIETARRIRERFDVPILFMTAYGDEATVARAMDSAPYGYLIKPYRPDELRATIKVVLQKHETEIRLRQSERWFSRTLHCISDGIIATTPSGHIRFINSVAEQLLGVRSEQVVNIPAKDVFTSIDSVSGKLQPDLIAMAMKERTNTPLHCGVLPKQDGHAPVYVDAGAAPILDGDLLLGGVLVLRDVTQSRLAEEELQLHRENLQQLVKERTVELEAAKIAAERASAAKSAFLSSMSHELRTPMHAVLGFSDLLQSEVPPGETLEYVQQIQKAGNHMVRLIDDMLDLSRVDAGKLTVAANPVDLAAVMAQAKTLVGAMLPEKNITLHVELPTGTIVRADETRLLQVLVNLLSNAIKYNQRDGHVWLRCAAFGSKGVRITVRDTGPGIAADKHASLFQPFERLGAEKSSIDGLGIGLAFSKRLVELMNGELGIEGAAGAGSTFWLTLPLAAA